MRFGVLGPLEVRDSQGRLVRLGAAKQRVLLTVLLLHANRPVSIDELVEALWPEQPPRRAVGALRTYVSALRQALGLDRPTGAWIAATSGAYQLTLPAGDLDLLVFQRCAGDGQRALADGAIDLAAEKLQDALRLWRGRVLEDVPLPVTLDGELAALEEHRLVVLEGWIDAWLALGRHAELLPELRRLVTAEPLRERLWAQWMLAMYRSGRQADALEAYHKLRRRLIDELAIEPSASLQRLQQQILSGDPALQPSRHDPAGGSRQQRTPAASRSAAAVPAQLPADVFEFTGRDRELAWLRAMLEARTNGGSAVTLATIAGAAGVGKTALAIHWAHRVRRRFPDGQLYVNLRGWAPGPPLSPIQALAQLLFGLGVEADKIPAEMDRAAGLYRSLLADRRVLVVLDNARDAEQVRPLIPGAPGCVVAVTSRDRLLGLVASHGAVRLTLDVLTPDEAVHLLARIVGEDRAYAEPEAVREFAEVCGHLPLALRVAAANLTSYPEEPIAGWLVRLRRGDQLAELSVDGDSTSAVHAAFDCSYATLDADVKRMFRLLGLVPGPDFTAHAAAALAGVPVERAGWLLERLAGAHLLQPRGAGRFDLHDLLRRYARQRSQRDDGEPDRRAALERLLAWYLHTADAADRLLNPQMVRLPVPAVDTGLPAIGFENHAGALEWLDGERANLVAAVQQAAQEGPRPLAWLLADALRGYFWGTRHLVDWPAVVGAALSAAQAEGGPQAQAAAHRSVGQVRQCLGDSAQAIEWLTSALELARQADWAVGEAAALGTLGLVYGRLGQLHQSTDYYVQARDLHRQAGSKGGTAVALGNLGDVIRQMGHPQQAAGHLTQALALYREIGSESGQQETLGNLGEAYRDLGRLADARACLTEALALAQDLGSRYGEASDLHALAMVQRDAGQLTIALELGEAALALAHEIGDPRLEADALNTLGSVHLCLGRDQQATEHHRTALDLARQTGVRYPETEALLGLAATCQQLGQHAQAVQQAEQARALACEMSSRILEGRAYAVLAAAYLARESYAAAVEQARQALAIFRETGHRLGQARALVVLAHALHSAEDTDGARSCWQEALDLFVDIGAPVPTTASGSS
jgi:DNA-binding SARP family transcriptional activator